MPAEPPVQSPASLAEALELLAAGGGWRAIAGGTDIMVQITGELGPLPERVLDIWQLHDLRGITLEEDGLTLGALTTYTDIRRSAVCAEHLPALVQAAATIGAAQIQNRGTIGGNSINASPAGDTLPILLATDATLILGSVRGERSVPAAEFWPAYRSSKVVMALSWREDGGVWRDVRLALGSVADRPIRARATEGVLEGAAARRETADHAAATVAQEISPIDDVRSTADYRRVVTARVLHRLLREAGGW
jgi:carbon-monoxide dehydrogenase medium subunit